MSFSQYFEEDDEYIQLELSAKLLKAINGKNKQAVGCACAIYVNDEKEPFVTESIWATERPYFQKKMSILPKFNIQQMLHIVLLEMTPIMTNVEDYNKFGDVKIPLGRVIVGGGVIVTLNGAAAEVSIKPSQESHGRGVLSMIVAFYNMPKNHWLNKNYPELHLEKRDNTGKWTTVYCSEIIKRQDSGQWDPISIPCKSICDDNYKKKIRLVVYDRETSEDSKEKRFFCIGYAETTVEKLSKMRNHQLVLTPSNKKVARAGNLIIRAAYLFERLTFYGQLQRGLRFNFACAIDFSASNRPPRDSKSLHYTSFGQLNPYQEVMNAIGGAIEPYADGAPFHAWGFAAKYNRVLSHGFPISLDGSKDLMSIKDLQNAYWSIFESIVFDNPICITPSTRHAMKQVKGSKNPSDYLVFLIMLNDVPQDLTEFLDFLYENQGEPISIIIVGIGDGPFKRLSDAISPGGLVNSNGEMFERDMAVFLEFNNFKTDGIEQFTSAALFTIPDQAIRWVDENVNFI